MAASLPFLTWFDHAVHRPCAAGPVASGPTPSPLVVGCGVDEVAAGDTGARSAPLVREVDGDGHRGRRQAERDTTGRGCRLGAEQSGEHQGPPCGRGDELWRGESRSVGGQWLGEALDLVRTRLGGQSRQQLIHVGIHVLATRRRGWRPRHQNATSGTRATSQFSCRSVKRCCAVSVTPRASSRSRRRPVPCGGRP